MHVLQNSDCGECGKKPVPIVTCGYEEHFCRQCLEEALAMLAKKPGRVYAVEPDVSKGERSGMFCRAFSEPVGDRFYNGVYRVEFDRDADEGPATVFAHVCDSQGVFHADPLQTDMIVRCSFRAYVRLRRKDGSRLDGEGPSGDPNYTVDAEGNLYQRMVPPESDSVFVVTTSS